MTDAAFYHELIIFGGLLQWIACMTRNYSLDFFRGVFAIVVALGHFYYWNNVGDVIPSSFVLVVDFFFILSGYVLSRSIVFGGGSDSERWFSDFTKRRIYRIFPAFLFIVSVHFVFLKLVDGIPWPAALDVFKVVTLTQLFPFGDGSNYWVEPARVGWSISGEFWVGLLFFPIIHALRNSNRGLLISSMALISLVLVVFISRTSPSQMNVHFQQWNGLPFGFVRVIIGFCIGVFIALTVSSSKADWMVSSMIQVGVLFIGVYLFAKLNWNRSDSYLAPFLGGALVWSLAKEEGVIFRLTNNWLGDVLGRMSYSIYLAHPAFVLYFRSHWSTSGLSVIAYIFMVFGSAYLVHTFVEQPAIDYIGRKQRAGRNAGLAAGAQST
ncbi:acyltransferase [Pseudomonas sp. PDNC002]|uniref:acyltransferase family protein n=1 Tax=Pseudomonas sp. PDNC002 TaxID=2811422 RepID=UPI0019648D47|nr:acyltransferase [Pseudomonas sp. PDNC002]QRY77525.1 acyltransferase [Pseudomonas sp. PDNC002]